MNTEEIEPVVSSQGRKEATEKKLPFLASLTRSKLHLIWPLLLAIVAGMVLVGVLIAIAITHH